MTKTAEALNPLTQYTPRYIIMDAPGCYGTYATVYGSYETLASARAAHKGNKRKIITTDGGWRTTHQPGSLIHREFAVQYKSER